MNGKKGAKATQATARKETASESEARRPFFVYGTLMPGFRNYELVLTGRCAFGDPSMQVLPAEAPRAALSNFKMVHYRAGFPGVKKRGGDDSDGDGQRVYGRLVWATGTSKARVETLRRLDALELYFGANDPRNEYERMLLPVELCGEGGAGDLPRTLEAWVYLTRVATTAGNETAVPHGDWARFVEETGVATAAGDWHDKLVEGEQQAVGSACASPASSSSSALGATAVKFEGMTAEAPTEADMAVGLAVWSGRTDGACDEGVIERRSAKEDMWAVRYSDGMLLPRLPSQMRILGGSAGKPPSSAPPLPFRANRVEATDANHVCNACNDDLVGTSSTWSTAASLWAVVFATCLVASATTGTSTPDSAGLERAPGERAPGVPPMNVFVAFFLCAVFSHFTRLLFSGRYRQHRPSIANMAANKGMKNLMRRIPWTLTGEQVLTLGRIVQGLLAGTAIVAAAGAPWWAVWAALVSLAPPLVLCCSQVFKPAPLAGHQACVALQTILFLVLSPGTSLATTDPGYAQCAGGLQSTWPLAFARACLCFFYCGSALHKLRGKSWVPAQRTSYVWWGNGTSMQFHITRTMVTHYPAYLKSHPVAMRLVETLRDPRYRTLAAVASSAALMGELLFPLAVLLPPVGLGGVFVLAGISFHVGTKIMFHLDFFSKMWGTTYVDQRR
jgi:gamma-glutamylcyclotransferase (GGCT)/AIG2-like uncharacterized protein YtfP